jgi:hypothetical protein
MPAAQPQATVIAIHRASTAAMINPRPHTALEVCPPPVRFANRIANPRSVGAQQRPRGSTCGESRRVRKQAGAGVPGRSREQRLRALEQASEVRTARAPLKKELFLRVRGPLTPANRRTYARPHRFDHRRSHAGLRGAGHPPTGAPAGRRRRSSSTTCRRAPTLSCTVPRTEEPQPAPATPKRRPSTSRRPLLTSSATSRPTGRAFQSARGFPPIAANHPTPSSSSASAARATARRPSSGGPSSPPAGSHRSPRTSPNNIFLAAGTRERQPGLSRDEPGQHRFAPTHLDPSLSRFVGNATSARGGWLMRVLVRGRWRLRCGG